MVPRSIPVARLAGIPVRVHGVLIVLIAALLWLARQRGGSAALVDTAIGAGIAMLALLVHELSHALAARRAGIPVSFILVGPFLNGTFLQRDPDQPAQELRIAASGPAANLLLAAAGAAVLWVSSSPGALERALRLWVWIHAAMGLGNLLPAFPLDGGRILRALLGRRLPWLVASRIVVRVGATLALALPGLALLFPQFRAHPLLWLAAAALCGALWLASRRAEKRALAREFLYQVAAGHASLDPEIARRVSPSLPPAGSGYRPLGPARFRPWEALCRQALHGTLGIPGE